MLLCVFFFKQKTAYEMRISDWSSDVCSSDLLDALPCQQCRDLAIAERRGAVLGIDDAADHRPDRRAGTFLSPPGNLRWEECLQFIEIGRAHVCTPVTNAHLVCRLLLETQNILNATHHHTQHSLPSISTTHDTPT